MVCALLTHCSPQAFHFAACFGIIGSCVDQPDPKSLADRGQKMTPIARTIIDEKDGGSRMLKKRSAEDFEQISFGFGFAHFEGEDVAASVIEDGMNTVMSVGTVFLLDLDVTDICMPYLT